MPRCEEKKTLPCIKEKKFAACEVGARVKNGVDFSACAISCWNGLEISRIDGNGAGKSAPSGDSIVLRVLDSFYSNYLHPYDVMNKRLGMWTDSSFNSINNERKGPAHQHIYRITIFLRWVFMISLPFQPSATVSWPPGIYFAGVCWYSTLQISSLLELQEKNGQWILWNTLDAGWLYSCHWCN